MSATARDNKAYWGGAMTPMRGNGVPERSTHDMNAHLLRNFSIFFKHLQGDNEHINAYLKLIRKLGKSKKRERIQLFRRVEKIMVRIHINSIAKENPYGPSGDEEFNKLNKVFPKWRERFSITDKMVSDVEKLYYMLHSNKELLIIALTNTGNMDRTFVWALYKYFNKSPNKNILGIKAQETLNKVGLDFGAISRRIFSNITTIVLLPKRELPEKLQKNYYAFNHSKKGKAYRHRKKRKVNDFNNITHAARR